MSRLGAASLVTTVKVRSTQILLAMLIYLKVQLADGARSYGPAIIAARIARLTAPPATM